MATKKSTASPLPPMSREERERLTALRDALRALGQSRIGADADLTNRRTAFVVWEGTGDGRMLVDMEKKLTKLLEGDDSDIIASGWAPVGAQS